jgi:hypothetical protein
MVPDFDSAVEQFRRFLSGEKIETSVVWIFRKDAIASGRSILLRIPLPAENERLARRCYFLGQERGLGLRIELLCILDGIPCCYIWVPEDQQAAEYAMLSGLKLCIPVEPINARAVQSSLRWNLNKYFSRRSNLQWVIDQLPARADIREVDRQVQLQSCSREGHSQYTLRFDVVFLGGEANGWNGGNEA